MNILQRIIKDEAFRASLVPFLITRALLLVVGFVSPLFLAVSDFQEAAVVDRGWGFTPLRLIDMWARWDSGWYLFTIKNGYSMGESVFVTSNLPFFPVFPLIVKALTFWIPAQIATDAFLLAVGIVVSNVLLFAGVVVLYKLVKHYFSKQVATTSLWFFLVFPVSFFLSSFYTESTFFFFSVVSLYAAVKGKWGVAAAAAMVVSATRPLGGLIGLPLVLEYMSQRDWKLKKLDLNVLWFALVPMGLLAFLTYMYWLTGDFLAPVKAQAAWGRGTSDPFTSFVFPAASWEYLTPFDQLFGISALVTGVAMLVEKSKRYWMFGSYVLVMILPAFFTGTMDSVTRFVAVLFPFFVYWAYLLQKNTKTRWILGGLMLLVQLVFFGLFSQFYWVG